MDTREGSYQSCFRKSEEEMRFIQLELTSVCICITVLRSVLSRQNIPSSHVVFILNMPEQAFLQW